MKRTIYIFLLALGLAVGPAAAQGEAKGKEASGNGDAVKAATADPGYVIGADDVLTVSVWKEAELTRSVVVRPDGMISIPLLGDVKADGLTPIQLATLLTERLRKFVNEPQVTVIVTTINSRLIHIVGEVNRAGTFPMLPNMTVLMALSGAGGFTQFANTKKIYVLRSVNGTQKKFPFNYKEVIKGNRSEENILLKPGDTIVVP